MKIKKVLFTESGLADTQKEYDELKAQRVGAVSELKTARELGDLSENAAYKVARMKLSSIDRRIMQLSSVLAKAEVVSVRHDGRVGIGSFVKLRKNDETVNYEIVGGYESDPVKGKISLFSPIGKSLLGKKAGEEVVVTAPMGTIRYSLLEVKG